ncbi:hypothetical protein [Pseudoalteromonas denitrificans]|uniref:Uncharacterized protein n=1 Tax=Pseudoalteromonas denitrificans DSM 6059 TaxID=1123010 RepID=A0A1I1KR33_9GAMM|nr:hypothetical protein [Pseudoalteromonas denitrificans]SFC60633.1 hypothetical protein SAMN02745724_02074 [Pseudoalteromonas denitrificans DSM 6059]
MSFKLTLFSLFILIASNSHADILKPFKSDGCSGFPDGTLKQNKLWLTCCKNHDFDYWKGGTYQQRLASDKRLKVCVSDVNEPEIALLMLAGVRVGGSPLLPTNFRWGYGWSYPRLYGELTDEELNQVKLLSNKSK